MAKRAVKENVKVEALTSGQRGSRGTSKDKKNPDRCSPKRKAFSLSKTERSITYRKNKS